MDFGSQYTDFDLCENYLYETPNNPNIASHSVSIVYLNNNQICLPTSKTWSFPWNSGIQTIKEAWEYTTFFKKKNYKRNITNTNPNNGQACKFFKYTYNSNNNLDTLVEISCSDSSKIVQNIFEWNSDGAVHKIIDFDPDYTQIENIHVDHMDAIFSYNGCAASATVEITSDQINLMPNPVWDNIIIDLDNFNEQEHSFNIINSIGEIVLYDKILSNKVTIDLSHLSKGIYFLQILGNNGFVTKQFVKI